MAIDAGQIAAATVTALAPFTPFLIEVGKAGAKELAEVVAAKGGETAWKKAQGLWGKIKARLGKDAEMQSAATMVAAKPESETRQNELAEVLGARLQADPALAQELVAALGGQEVIQKVLAESGGQVRGVRQTAAGTARSVRQEVIARDQGTVEDVEQRQG
jgi:hypothetical protein